MQVWPRGSLLLLLLIFSVSSVLTTVLGVYPERGSALCDAGSRALGKDTLEQPSSSPWGIVLQQPLLHLVSISQEVERRKRNVLLFMLLLLHTQVGILKGPGVAALVVGQQLRIVPNHSCLTATNFSQVRALVFFLFLLFAVSFVFSITWSATTDASWACMKRRQEDLCDYQFFFY